MPLHLATRTVVRSPFVFAVIGRVVLVAFGGSVGAPVLVAQPTPAAMTGAARAAHGWLDMIAGSEEERYARVLQVAGRAPWHQWSLRPFSVREVAQLAPREAEHPWASVLALGAKDTSSTVAAVVQPSVQTFYNSTFPYSINDGAIWTGRGATIAATGGVMLRYGVLSVRLQPIAFLAQNQGFTLMPNGYADARRFGDPLEPFAVDAPQRFGDGTYARLDPGQSTVRLDLFGVAVGASTANEIWGPAQVDPLLLGTNAAGIPRVFLGTSRPVSWGLGTVHVRVETGALGQSTYASTAPDSTRRLMAGLVGVVTFRGVPGLEVGAGRFYHRPWSTDAFVRGFRVPFERLFKDQLPGKDENTADNQLASVFARWTVPAAAFEAYGEFGRNDHNQSVRDLLEEPDHNSAYMLGLQRIWGGRSDRLVTVRAETMNARITHLARIRGQARWNQHDALRQGHTQYGELLGSAAGLGGSATTLGVDIYQPDGRWTFEAARRVRQQPITESAESQQFDVYGVLRAERLRFTRAGDVTLGAALIDEVNRDFRRDAFGVRVDVAWRRR